MKVEIISMTSKETTQEQKVALEEAVMNKIVSGFDAYVERKKQAEQRKFDRMIEKLKAQKLAAESKENSLE